METANLEHTRRVLFRSREGIRHAQVSPDAAQAALRLADGRSFTLDLHTREQVRGPLKADLYFHQEIDRVLAVGKDRMGLFEVVRGRLQLIQREVFKGSVKEFCLDSKGEYFAVSERAGAGFNVHVRHLGKDNFSGDRRESFEAGTLMAWVGLDSHVCAAVTQMSPGYKYDTVFVQMPWSEPGSSTLTSVSGAVHRLTGNAEGLYFSQGPLLRALSPELHDLYRVQPEEKRWSSCLALSPQGRHLAVADNQTNLRILELQSRGSIRSAVLVAADRLPEPVVHCAFNSSGGLVVVTAFHVYGYPGVVRNSLITGTI